MPANTRFLPSYHSPWIFIPLLFQAEVAEDVSRHIWLKEIFKAHTSILIVMNLVQAQQSGGEEMMQGLIGMAGGNRRYQEFQALTSSDSLKSLKELRLVN